MGAETGTGGRTHETRSPSDQNASPTLTMPATAPRMMLATPMERFRRRSKASEYSNTHSSSR